MTDQNKVNVNSSNKHAETKNSNFSKFQNINQYDQPNQFYKIGPYVLDQVIGKGNFSVVKLAIHTPTQMQVAIKILHKSKMTKETLEKTYREVHIMKQLSHPYIVRLYQVIDSVEWLFIVMEYTLNGELFDQLSRVGRFNENDARLKFGQILDAVDYCHQMNIVHRDLKAENILLDKYQNIKLADFGFGSFYDNSYLLSTWCGSPPYAAPELFKGEPYIGPKADIWSLGVILYAMVCGTLPFDEPTNIVKLREQVLSGWVRFPYFLSYECEHLIRMILNRSPMKRPTIGNIKNHKWMQPTFDNSSFILESSPRCDKELWNSPSQIYSPQRCNTLGADSGFDEPISDFCKPSSINASILTKTECKDFNFNEHAIQIMERCGINRVDICEELINKRYGSHTATYLLLSERLRIHRQSYPPLKQEYISNNCSFITQPNLKPETPNPIKFVSENNQFKQCSTDLLENINSDFKQVQITDKKYSQNDRRSPYENIKNNFRGNVNTKNFINSNSETHEERDSFNQSKRENNSNEVLNFQEAQQNARRRNTSSVIVDLIVPHEQAIQEINIPNQKSSLLAFQLNEGMQILTKNESVNSPEYIVSYPRDYLTSRKHSNLTPQTCIVLDPSRTLKDTHIPNGIKFNNSNQLPDSFSPYPNFYQLQHNATHHISSLHKYGGVSHHHQNPMFNDTHHQYISPGPIMIAAQSTNAPSGLNNNFYNGVIKDTSQDLQNQVSPSQFYQRNQCSDSSLQCDHNIYGQKPHFDFPSIGLEVKSDNLNPVPRSVVEAESNFRNLQLISNFNTPLLIRTNNYSQCNEQMIPCQPQISHERYAISNDQKKFVPYSPEIPTQQIPAFNIIPISKFVPADLNYIKFS